MTDETSNPLTAEKLGDDLLQGIAQIASFLNEKERRALYMLEQQQIPAKQIGRRWYARKSELTAFFSSQA